jgi:hypothetical protein
VLLEECRVTGCELPRGSLEAKQDANGRGGKNANRERGPFLTDWRARRPRDIVAGWPLVDNVTRL